MESQEDKQNLSGLNSSDAVILPQSMPSTLEVGSTTTSASENQSSTFSTANSSMQPDSEVKSSSSVSISHRIDSDESSTLNGQDPSDQKLASSIVSDNPEAPNVLIEPSVNEKLPKNRPTSSSLTSEEELSSTSGLLANAPEVSGPIDDSILPAAVVPDEEAAMVSSSLSSSSRKKSSESKMSRDSQETPRSAARGKSREGSRASSPPVRPKSTSPSPSPSPASLAGASLLPRLASPAKRAKSGKAVSTVTEEKEKAPAGAAPPKKAAKRKSGPGWVYVSESESEEEPLPRGLPASRTKAPREVSGLLSDEFARASLKGRSSRRREAETEPEPPAASADKRKRPRRGRDSEETHDDVHATSASISPQRKSRGGRTTAASSAAATATSTAEVAVADEEMLDETEEQRRRNSFPSKSTPISTSNSASATTTTNTASNPVGSASEAPATEHPHRKTRDMTVLSDRVSLYVRYYLDKFARENRQNIRPFVRNQDLPRDGDPWVRVARARGWWTDDSRTSALLHALHSRAPISLPASPSSANPLFPLAPSSQSLLHATLQQQGQESNVGSSSGRLSRGSETAGTGSPQINSTLAAATSAHTIARLANNATIPSTSPAQNQSTHLQTNTAASNLLKNGLTNAYVPPDTARAHARAVELGGVNEYLLHPKYPPRDISSRVNSFVQREVALSTACLRVEQGMAAQAALQSGTGIPYVTYQPTVAPLAIPPRVSPAPHSLLAAELCRAAAAAPLQSAAGAGAGAPAGNVGAAAATKKMSLSQYPPPGSAQALLYPPSGGTSAYVVPAPFPSPQIHPGSLASAAESNMTFIPAAATASPGPHLLLGSTTHLPPSHPSSDRRRLRFYKLGARRLPRAAALAMGRPVPDSSSEDSGDDSFDPLCPFLGGQWPSDVRPPWTRGRDFKDYAYWSVIDQIEQHDPMYGHREFDEWMEQMSIRKEEALEPAVPPSKLQRKEGISSRSTHNSTSKNYLSCGYDYEFDADDSASSSESDNSMERSSGSSDSDTSIISELGAPEVAARRRRRRAHYLRVLERERSQGSDTGSEVPFWKRARAHRAADRAFSLAPHVSSAPSSADMHPDVSLNRKQLHAAYYRPGDSKEDRLAARGSRCRPVNFGLWALTELVEKEREFSVYDKNEVANGPYIRPPLDDGSSNVPTSTGVTSSAPTTSPSAPLPSTTSTSTAIPITTSQTHAPPSQTTSLSSTGSAIRFRLPSNVPPSLPMRAMNSLQPSTDFGVPYSFVRCPHCGVIKEYQLDSCWNECCPLCPLSRTRISLVKSLPVGTRSLLRRWFLLLERLGLGRGRFPGGRGILARRKRPQAIEVPNWYATQSQVGNLSAAGTPSKSASAPFFSVNYHVAHADRAPLSQFLPLEVPAASTYKDAAATSLLKHVIDVSLASVAHALAPTLPALAKLQNIGGFRGSCPSAPGDVPSASALATAFEAGGAHARAAIPLFYGLVFNSTTRRVFSHKVGTAKLGYAPTIFPPFRLHAGRYERERVLQNVRLSKSSNSSTGGVLPSVGLPWAKRRGQVRKHAVQKGYTAAFGREARHWRKNLNAYNPLQNDSSDSFLSSSSMEEEEDMFVDVDETRRAYSRRSIFAPINLNRFPADYYQSRFPVDDHNETFPSDSVAVSETAFDSAAAPTEHSDPPSRASPVGLVDSAPETKDFTEMASAESKPGPRYVADAEGWLYKLDTDDEAEEGEVVLYADDPRVIEAFGMPAQAQEKQPQQQGLSKRKDLRRGSKKGSHKVSEATEPAKQDYSFWEEVARGTKVYHFDLDPNSEEYLERQRERQADPFGDFDPYVNTLTDKSLPPYLRDLTYLTEVDAGEPVSVYELYSTNGATAASNATPSTIPSSTTPVQPVKELEKEKEKEKEEEEESKLPTRKRARGDMPTLPSAPSIPAPACLADDGADDLLPDAQETRTLVAEAAYKLASTADATVLSNMLFDAPVVFSGSSSHPPCVQFGDPDTGMLRAATRGGIPDEYLFTTAAAIHQQRLDDVHRMLSSSTTHTASVNIHGSHPLTESGTPGASMSAFVHMGSTEEWGPVLRTPGYPSIGVTPLGSGVGGCDPAADGAIYRSSSWCKGDEDEHPDLHGAKELISMAFMALPLEVHKSLSRHTHDRMKSVHLKWVERHRAEQAAAENAAAAILDIRLVPSSADVDHSNSSTTHESISLDSNSSADSQAVYSDGERGQLNEVSSQAEIKKSEGEISNSTIPEGKIPDFSTSSVDVDGVVSTSTSMNTSPSDQNNSSAIIEEN